MVRPWVEISLGQYEKLKRLTEKKDKPLSGIIREAVCEFLKKKDFPTGTAVSSLARGTRNRYKPVSAYLSRSDWNLIRFFFPTLPLSLKKRPRRCLGL